MTFGCIDEETGVLNRRYLLTQLREHLAIFAAYGTTFSVLCIQVDQIEHFQATHGVRAVSAIQRDCSNARRQPSAHTFLGPPFRTSISRDTH
jgi:GGDEF domain-containing protein